MLGKYLTGMAAFPGIAGTEDHIVAEAFHEGGDRHGGQLSFGLASYGDGRAEKPFLRPGHDHALEVIVFHAPHGASAAQLKRDSDNTVDFLRIYAKRDPLVPHTFKMLHGFLP